MPTNSVVVPPKESRTVRLQLLSLPLLPATIVDVLTYLGSLDSVPTYSVVVSPKESGTVRLQLLLLVLLATTANVAVRTLVPWAVCQHIVLL
jgi:hypothetical protein